MFNSTILSFPTSWFLKFFDLLENNFKTSKTVSTFKFFNSSEIKMAADAKKIPVLFYCKKSLTFCSTKAISNENKVLFSNAQVAAVLEKKLLDECQRFPSFIVDLSSQVYLNKHVVFNSENVSTERRLVCKNSLCSTQSILGGLHSTDEAFLLPTQQPQV